MLLTVCKSKIDGARVTEACLEYQGSITIDADLVEAAGFVPHEQVHVLNLNNGERVITYLIVGERGSGVMCLNGPAARTGLVGDRITVLSYAQVTPEEAQGWQITRVQVDAQNRKVG
jgi:aspartate 1-decarboxylase